VEVHGYRFDGDSGVVETKWFSQDSGYGSPLVRLQGRNDPANALFQRTLYGAAYFRGRPGADVLVIGLGGAPDVQAALFHEAASGGGVAIDGTAVERARGPYRESRGDPYGDPRVGGAIRDGRSFARADDRLYDVIQMSGVDTKSTIAAGSLAVNESYLYTVE